MNPDKVDIQSIFNEKGFKKLFELFRNKYCSLGRVGGSVNVSAFDEKEMEAIAGFLGESPSRMKSRGSISLSKFEQELSRTNLSTYTLVSLLETYFNEPLVTKKAAAELEKQQEQLYINGLKDLLPGLHWYISFLEKRDAGARWIWSWYKQDAKELTESLQMVDQAFRSLPKEGEFERMPLFAQRVTGNPHSLDMQGNPGKLFIHSLTVHYRLNANKQMEFPKDTESLNLLLSEYGLLRDDLWNFVTCQGLLGFSNGHIHPVWQAAAECLSVLNMPMKELEKVDAVTPVNGQRVWIVENSSVSSTLMDACPNMAIVCTHGQLRAASWRLIHLLVESGTEIYYSGDLDPEGIMIADRLKQRYPASVQLWRMDQEAYQISMSEEDITSRLSKLQNILSIELEAIAAALLQYEKAGYQEALVSRLIEDIKQYSLG